MKKLIVITLVGIVGLSTFFVACKKEVNDLKNQPISKTEKVQDFEKADPIVIVRCTPHRKKYDCMDGWGLCNCVWFPDAPRYDRISTTVISSGTMRLSSPSFADNGENIFYIDEDFSLPDEAARALMYSSITILKGDYIRESEESVVVNVKLII